MGETKDKQDTNAQTSDQKGNGSNGGSVGMDGRRFPKSTPNSPQHEELVEIQNESTSEDSVSEDIHTFKKFMKKFSGKVNDKVQPIAKKGLQKSKEAIATTTSKVSQERKKRNFDFSIVKKLMVVVLLIMAVIIVGIVGVGFYVRSQQPTTQPPTVAPTPTPPTYQTYKPSVYAKDPEVLNIEETLDILNREMDTTNLSEDDLKPPQLDFGISFQ